SRREARSFVGQGKALGGDDTLQPRTRSSQRARGEAGEIMQSQALASSWAVFSDEKTHPTLRLACALWELRSKGGNAAVRLARRSLETLGDAGRFEPRGIAFGERLAPQVGVFLSRGHEPTT